MKRKKFMRTICLTLCFLMLAPSFTAFASEDTFNETEPTESISEDDTSSQQAYAIQNVELASTLDFSEMESEVNTTLGYDWNATKKTLILENFNHITLTAGIILPADSVLSIRGKNLIKSTNWHGIEAKGNLTINHYAGASLTIEADARGIETSGNLVIDGGTITIDARDKGIAANAFTLNVADVQVISSNENPVDVKDITVNSGNLLATTSGPKIALATTNYLQNGGTVKAISKNHAGMWVNSSFALKDGKMDVISNTSGNNARGINSNGANFQISGGELTVTSGNAGIYTGGKIDVTGGQITIDAPNSVNTSQLTMNSSNTLLQATGTVQNVNLINGFVLSENFNRLSGTFSIERDVALINDVYVDTEQNPVVTLQSGKTLSLESGTVLDLGDGTLNVRGILKNNGSILGNVVMDGGSVVSDGIIRNPNNKKEWIIQGESAQVPANFVVKSDERLVINEGQTLTIPDGGLVRMEKGAVVENNGTILNQGTLGAGEPSQLGDVQGNAPLSYGVQEMYTIANFDHLSKAALNRGQTQDRHHLGVYTKENASIQIRQTNPNFDQNLTFHYFNNNGNNAVSAAIPANGNWVTVTAKVDSVGFVKTPMDRNGEKPVIEYLYDDNSPVLPVYEYEQTNEREFFDFWNQSNAPYAVYDSPFITILVPAKDKNANKFGSIDELFDMYGDMMDHLDRFAGLEDYARNPVNQNVKAKYFALANATGGGAAYYGTDHVAATSDSVAWYLGLGWGTVHEVAHGYQGSFMGRDLNLGEVWNNVYGHYFQHNSDYKFGDWLNINAYMNNFEQDRVKFGYNKSGLSTELYFWVNMLDTIGAEKSMAHFNRAYRELVAQGKQFEVSSTDLMARVFSEAGNFNVAPYFEAWGLEISPATKNYLHDKGYKHIYPLRYLTGNDQKAQELQSSLGAERIYSLVEIEKLMETQNLTSNLEVTFDIDDFEQINGKEIIFYNGNEEIRRVTITQPTMVIESMPVGLFTMQIPSAKQGNYKSGQYQYVAVALDSDNKTSVSYTAFAQSALGSDFEIRFAGLGDGIYATLKHDPIAKTITANNGAGAPHSYFPNQDYSSVIIRDADNNVVYTKSHIGDKSNQSLDTIPFDEGYTIEIMHKEAIGRLGVYSNLMFGKKILGVTQNTNVFVYEGGVLKLQKDTTPSEKILSNLLDDYLAYLQGNNLITDMEDAIHQQPYKSVIASTIQALPEEDKDAVKEKHENLFGNGPEIIMETDTLHVQMGDNLQQALEQLELSVEDKDPTTSTDNIEADVSAIDLDSDGNITNEGEFEVLLTVTNSFFFSSTRTIKLTVGASDYTIRFETNGGNDLELVTAEKDQTIQISSLPTPEKDGYTFDGWYTDETLTIEATDFTMTANQVTLFAKWTVAGKFAELDRMIQKAQSLDQSLYTEASWTKLQNALDFADFIKGMDSPTQADIDEAIQNIKSTMSHLQLK